MNTLQSYPFYITSRGPSPTEHSDDKQHTVDVNWTAFACMTDKESIVQSTDNISSSYLVSSVYK